MLNTRLEWREGNTKWKTAKEFSVPHFPSDDLSRKFYLSLCETQQSSSIFSAAPQLRLRQFFVAVFSESFLKSNQVGRAARWRTACVSLRPRTPRSTAARMGAWSHGWWYVGWALGPLAPGSRDPEAPPPETRTTPCRSLRGRSSRSTLWGPVGVVAVLTASRVAKRTYADSRRRRPSGIQSVRLPPW